MEGSIQLILIICLVHFRIHQETIRVRAAEICQSLFLRALLGATVLGTGLSFCGSENIWILILKAALLFGQWLTFEFDGLVE